MPKESVRPARPRASTGDGRPEGGPLLRLWRETVGRDPGAAALVESAGGRRWTRRALAESADEWRGRVASGEDLSGRCVVLAEPNGAPWFAAFLGLLSAGAVPALVDPTEPPDAREAIARRIGAAWVWTGERLAAVRGGGRRRGPECCLAKVTSGSTGQPKAFVFTHAQMIADGRQICATMGIGGSDVNLAVIPFGHSYGLGNLVMPLLLQGTAAVCGSGPFPRAIAADCRKWKPTVFPSVPVLLRAMIRSDAPAESLAGLRLVVSAGSPMAAADARAFRDRFGLAVRGFYGSSETGGICYDRTGEATLAGSGVGAPLVGVRLAPSRRGRFVVESPAVMGSGRHSPPDLGRLSPSGELTLLGRVGRTIKVAGRRLDLREVTAALRALPAVKDAVVLPHPRALEALAAVVVSDASPAELRGALAGRIAAWKIPDRILGVPEMPATPSGKLDRRRIEALLRGA